MSPVIRDHHPETGDASFGGIALDALKAARDAQAKADENARDIEAHEDICAERYKTINEKLGTIFKIIVWAGGTGFMLIMGLLAFFAKTQFEMMDSAQKATAQRTEILERSRTSEPPQVIIQPAPGQTGMGASVERQH